MTALPTIGCAQLRAALDQVTESESSDIAGIIEAHLAACPRCQASERSLAPLIERYRAMEQPISDELFQRLLARMCP